MKNNIKDVIYGMSGSRLTTCTIIFEDGTEAIGSAYSADIPQMSPELKQAAKADAAQQLEKSKYQILYSIEENYMLSWNKFMKDVETRLLKELKKKGIKLRNIEKRAEWIKEHVRISMSRSGNLNQVYVYPDTPEEDLLFIYDSGCTIKETDKGINVSFGGIMDLTPQGRTLADKLKEDGVKVESEEYYEKLEQEAKNGKSTGEESKKSE